MVISKEDKIKLEPSVATGCVDGSTPWYGMVWYGMVWYGMVLNCMVDVGGTVGKWYGMVWYGMVEVYEGAPVAVSGLVLTDRHDLAPCAAVSVPGAAVSCRWSPVSVFGGRRCPSPTWWSVLVLVAAVILLMVMVVVQLLVLVHAVVVEAVACVVVVAVAVVRWW